MVSCLGFEPCWQRPPARKPDMHSRNPLACTPPRASYRWSIRGNRACSSWCNDSRSKGRAPYSMKTSRKYCNVLTSLRGSPAMHRGRASRAHDARTALRRGQRKAPHQAPLMATHRRPTKRRTIAAFIIFPKCRTNRRIRSDTFRSWRAPPPNNVSS